MDGTSPICHPTGSYQMLKSTQRFDKYKEKVTILENPILSFFLFSYPLTLFGWHIIHLSSHGTPSETQINSVCHQDSHISLCRSYDEYKRGSDPYKISRTEIFFTPPILPPSLDSKSSISHPKGPHQRPKSTQCAPNLARYPFVDVLMNIVEVTPIKSPLLSFFRSSYPMTFLG